jgi:hypothetical protein
VLLLREEFVVDLAVLGMQRFRQVATLRWRVELLTRMSLLSSTRSGVFAGGRWDRLRSRSLDLGVTLSSVKHTQNRQLNLSPRLPVLTRLLVEPLALRLARCCEAPQDHSCRLIASVFSTDSVAGSDYVVLLSLLVVH